MNTKNKVYLGIIGVLAFFAFLGHISEPQAQVAGMHTEINLTQSPTRIPTKIPHATPTYIPTPLPITTQSNNNQDNSPTQGDPTVTCVLDNVTFQLPKSQCDKDQALGAQTQQEVQQAEQQNNSYSAPTSAPINISTAPPTSSGLSNDNSYTNSQGNEVHSPAYSTNNSIPAGATAQCNDGTYSFSQSRSGTCSHHGGVAQWL